MVAGPAATASSYTEGSVLAEDEDVYTIESTDVAGNVGSTSVIMRVDLSAPLFAPTGGANMKIDITDNGIDDYTQQLHDYDATDAYVDTIRITFNEPVVGFDVGDLGLYRYQAGGYTSPTDGLTNTWIGASLTGVTVTQDPTDPNAWLISGLSGITSGFSGDWDYTLVASTSWEMDIEDPLGHESGLMAIGAHWTQYEV